MFRSSRSSPSSPKLGSRRRRHWPRLSVVELEPRNTPSVSMSPAALHAHLIPAGDPVYSGAPAYYPADIASVYGFNLIHFLNPQTGKYVTGDGTGQTIAIVDAGDSPTVAMDLASFDAKFHLPAPPSFQKVNWAGQTVPLPPPVEDWAVEIALDVEWAHALAPKANIVLFEAATPTIGNVDDLGTAVQSAANPATYGPLGVPVAGVISNSYGGGEFSSEASLDYIYTTPDNHATFVASTGDSGAPGGWPAYSPDVLATGGTSLYTRVNSAGVTVYQKESGWSSGGGGVSVYEPKPSYQSGLSYSARSIPDVAIDSDPNTGMYVILAGQAFEVGGTSAAAPMWSAMLAVLNQGRALNGEGTLGNAQALVYGLATKDFHDVTSGNNGFAAGRGYDLVTGIGSPHANYVVKDLLFASSGTVPASTTQPTPHGQGTQVTRSVTAVRPGTVHLMPQVPSFTVSARPDEVVTYVSKATVVVLARSSVPATPVTWSAATHFGAPAANGDLLMVALDLTTAGGTTTTAAALPTSENSKAQAAEMGAVGTDEFPAAYALLRTTAEAPSGTATEASGPVDPILMVGVSMVMAMGLQPGQDRGRQLPD
ncbi:MAG TPA: S53 family peptidase [Gemmataceae bacterium]|nr:S53 family peptidase [Gemmataceae bacterium]